MGILKQWKSYIEWVHYKITLKKKFKRVIKEARLIDKKIQSKKLKFQHEIDIFKKQEKEFIGQLKHYQDPDKSLRLFLVGNIIKEKWYKKLWQRIFKFDGYILHCNKAKELKFYKIKDMRYLKSIKNRELYNLHKKVGIYKNKPLFFVVYPHAISLEIKKDSDKLYYDTEAYYNYVNIATKGNLTKSGEQLDIMTMIRKNLVLIIIIICVLIALFTPEGQQFIQGIIQGQ